MNNNLNEREVDKLSTKKGKNLLWASIRKKYNLDNMTVKNNKPNDFWNWFAVTFLSPVKLAGASVVAVLLIVALVLGPNLGFFNTKQMIAHASFEMTASDEDSTGIASDAIFTLTANEDLSESQIKDNLVLEPAADFEVNKLDVGEYEITLSNELNSNTVYNFSIDTNDGNFSWAYQVREDFKVYSTLPGNQASGAPLDGGIEINFSHENFDFKNVDKFFEISPKVDGSFEKHYKTLSFVPKGGLEPSTVYTVTLKAGFSVNASDLKLSDNYSFQFETYSEYIEKNIIAGFAKQNYQMKEGAPFALNVYSYIYKSGYSNSDTEEESKVEIEILRYKDDTEFVKALKRIEDLPFWAYHSREDFRHPKSGLESLGVYESVIAEADYQSFVYLPDLKLEKGYYLVEIKDDNRGQALLQVSNLSNYLNITETDSLVWVNDLATKNPSVDASVEILTNGQSFKTDKEGIAKFTTPNVWKKSYDEQISEIVKVSNGDDVLFDVIYPYENNMSQAKYWYHFHTDRAMYLPKDKAYFWGFIEGKDGKKVDKLRVEMKKDWSMLIDEFTVDVKNGIFEGDIAINDFLPGYYNLDFYSGDKWISSESLTISDYVKPAYKIDVTTDRDRVFAGEMMNFDVASMFFDGTPVSNIALEYYNTLVGYRDRLQTDVNGKTSLSIEAPFSQCTESGDYYYCNDMSNYYLSIESPEAEETNISSSIYVQVFNSKIYLTANNSVEEGTATVDIEANWVDLEGDDYIGEAARSRKVSGVITKITWDQIDDGEYYDYINKKVIKKYRYETNREHLQDFNMLTDGSGKASYEFLIDEDAYYLITFKSTDDDGNVAHSSTNVYGAHGGYPNSFYNTRITNGEGEEYYNKTFNLNETVEAAIFDGESAVSEPGQFLFQTLNNGLISYSIEGQNSFKEKYSEKYLPQMYVDAVWFNGDNYISAGYASAYFNKETKRLNIDVKTDKESYEPGEFVTLDLEVTNQSGDGVGADVNLNLVDEAFFKLVYDNVTDPLDKMYNNSSTGSLYDYKSHMSPMTAKMDAEMSGMGGCFTAETLISMADGSTKAIKDIKVGDMVLSRKSPWSVELVGAEVLNTVEHFVGEYFVINDTLEVTGEHVVFVNGKWDLAENVKVGDMLQTADGRDVEVYNIRKAKEPVWVFNFEVEGLHTYIADGFYVHNDKGGDGVRNDFEDTALFESVRTDSSGKASVRFQLPDNITSWRVMARGVDLGSLSAGLDVGNVKVSLPMFVDLVINREYSVKDSPVVKFRTFGDKLSDGDKVSYTVDGNVLESEAFASAYYKLPELILGKHTFEVHADALGYKDAISKDYTVKGSRLSQTFIDTLRKVDASSQIKTSGEGATEVRFVDGGLGLAYRELIQLYYSDGERIDQSVLKKYASDILKDKFGEEYYVSDEFKVMIYQDRDGGLKLLPYGESDLRLTAYFTLFSPTLDGFDKNSLEQYFYSRLEAKDGLNVDEVVLSLAGLSGVNAPVLNSLRLIVDDKNITPEDKVVIALAFKKLGSRNEALGLYKELQTISAMDSRARALYAILAMSLDLDEAAEIWESVQLTGIQDEILNIFRIGFADQILKNSNPSPVKFTVSVGDISEDVSIEKYDIHSVLVPAGEKVKVSNVSGELMAISIYTKEIEPSKFVRDNRISLDRAYYVGEKKTDTFKEGDLVKVVLTLTENEYMKNNSYLVTDVLPSGLRLLTQPYFFEPYYGGESRIITHPNRAEGQIVKFYLYQHEEENFGTVTYYARVVGPGQYYADPAKAEAFNLPTIVNISEPDFVDIK